MFSDLDYQFQVERFRDAIDFADRQRLAKSARPREALRFGALRRLAASFTRSVAAVGRRQTAVDRPNAVTTFPPQVA